MIVALVALATALGGTAYAAGQINGNSIQKQSIGEGKLKQKTLTGYQINVDKLGEVPLAKRTTHTFWAVVHNPAGQGNAPSRGPPTPVRSPPPRVVAPST
jgi:hypothetical protein